jgi:hypothetical protein
MQYSGRTDVRVLAAAGLDFWRVDPNRSRILRHDAHVAEARALDWDLIHRRVPYCTK